MATTSGGPRGNGRPADARRTRAAALLALAAGLAVGQGATGNSVSPEAAQELVRNTTERVFAEVERQRDAIEKDRAVAFTLVDQLVTPHVDLERAARWVLGKHWGAASAEQRTRFKQEFHTLLLRTYTVAVTEFTGLQVDYLPMRPEDKPTEATVRTKVPQSNGPPISINYRLHADDGMWKVFDVAIEGVSILTTYRSTFSSEVRRFGLDGLIQRMIEKNQSGGT